MAVDLVLGLDDVDGWRWLCEKWRMGMISGRRTIATKALPTAGFFIDSNALLGYGFSVSPATVSGGDGRITQGLLCTFLFFPQSFVDTCCL